jgi:hypothetical protein
MTTEKGKSETQLGKQPEEMGAEKEGEAAISQGLPKTAGKATQRMILPRAFRGEFAFEGTLTLDFKMCIRCTLQVLHMPGRKKLLLFMSPGLWKFVPTVLGNAHLSSQPRRIPTLGYLDTGAAASCDIELAPRTYPEFVQVLGAICRSKSRDIFQPCPKLNIVPLFCHYKYTRDNQFIRQGHFGSELKRVWTMTGGEAVHHDGTLGTHGAKSSTPCPRGTRERGSIWTPITHFKGVLPGPKGFPHYLLFGFPCYFIKFESGEDWLAKKV